MYFYQNGKNDLINVPKKCEPNANKKIIIEHKQILKLIFSQQNFFIKMEQTQFNPI